MERRLSICMIVWFLGITAFALGIAAEFKTIKESDIHFFAPGGCEYPRTPAFALGLTAFVVLFIAHTMIHTSAGCFCCNLRLCSCAVFYAFMSWSMFALACIRLLEGSMVNDRHEMYSDVCYEAFERWIFARGALWSLGSITYGVLFYLSKSSIKDMNQMGT
ncbi:uncharacterized protein LOC113274141 [Papaver somniferum]|uniref:uncharacterized protein LOC113274141 n=1 Tax=Papaver somniferum TaxID=3469 RepID=UPI000E6F64CA|nr:uncharacterized protein LOC113274141 [Papaver somniferum]XP_026379414.1 uncharacterized protein LOC113274141 [Papaver somniferum]